MLGVTELALAGGSSDGLPWLTGVFQKAFQCRPWTDEYSFRSVLAEARKPASDPRIPAEVVKLGLVSRPVDPRSFVECRAEIYARELVGTAGLLLGILAVAWLTSCRSRRGLLPACLIALTFLDLLILSRHRLVSVGPLRSLVNQSPVLEQLAREQRGTRIIDGFRSNLPMLVGLQPVIAYRTLDLPALEPLTNLARGPLGDDRFAAPVRKAMRTVGVGVQVLDPIETNIELRRAKSKGSTEDHQIIDDPTLAEWIFGPEWGSRQGAWSSRFRILHPQPDPHRAWFVPLTAVSRPAMLDHWEGEIEPVLKLFDQASPQREESRRALVMDVSVEADAPDGLSSRNWPTPSGGLAGWTATVEESSGPRSCQPFVATAVREAGSESGCPDPGAGGCTWSTWQRTSSRDWQSQGHRGWSGASSSPRSRLGNEERKMA